MNIKHGFPNDLNNKKICPVATHLEILDFYVG